MTGFRRTAGGASARFSADEARLLRSLVTQIADLLGADPADQADAAGDTAGAPAGGEPGSGAGSAAPGSPDDLAEMLGALDGPATPPEDPVLARLLPDAYTDDPEAAGDFRRYTEQSLRSEKAEAAQEVLGTLPASGGRVRLSGEQGQVWLRAINDVRLALGVRLGITEDFEGQLAGLPAEDPRQAYFRLYDWVTYLQESLVRALW